MQNSFMAQEGKRKFATRFIRVFWWIVGGGVFLVVLLFVLIAVGAFGPMPSFEELENPRSNMASEVLAEDQTVLGSYYIQNRSFVSREDLAPCLVDALVTTEDVRFSEHSGIDARGVSRVLVKTMMMGRNEAGGGSTLTQQLAKNLFPRDTIYSRNALVRGFKLGVTKLKEWVTAVKLERNYTKDEILTMYLNTVPFGSHAYGIKMAARTFFNTTADSLRVEEAALLVGLVKGPTWYSPVRNPQRSLERRNVVLNQMCRYGRLTPQARDSLVQLPLNLNYRVQDHNTGLATYFREALRQIMTASEPDASRYYSHEQYQTDSVQWAENPLYGWCNKNRKPDGSPYNLYRDGLKIHTCIDASLQRYAEEAVAIHLGKTLQPAFDAEKRNHLFTADIPRNIRDQVHRSGVLQSDRYRNLKAAGATEEEIRKSFDTPTEMTVFSWKGDRDTVMTPMDSMKYAKRQLRVGFMAMEPRTGRLRAYVGGPSFKYFKYDQVYYGRRQVGSTIKPFLYTLAMQEGYSPCFQVPNVPQVFNVNDEVWTPKNAGKTEHDGEMVTLKWGLAKSVNNISAWLIKQFSPESVADLIHKMGIHSYIDPVPSIFLGTSEFNVYELTAAYGVFASGGVHVTPQMVSRIEDKNGNILATFTPVRREVISAETAHLMVELLRNVVDHGSGRRLRYVYSLPGALGGKTGTTQKGSDGWFMMIHPSIVIGTWVGAEDPAVHFAGMALGQGASMALPITGLFMQRAYADPASGIKPNDRWIVPPSLVGVRFDCNEHDDPSGDTDEFF